MGVKTNGKEFLAFYNSDWTALGLKKDAYVEEEEIFVGTDKEPLPEIGGYDQIPADARVTVSGGTIRGGSDENDYISFEATFRKWIKRQNTRTILVEVDATKYDAVMAAIKKAGGKV